MDKLYKQLITIQLFCRKEYVIWNIPGVQLLFIVVVNCSLYRIHS